MKSEENPLAFKSIKKTNKYAACKTPKSISEYTIKYDYYFLFYFCKV